MSKPLICRPCQDARNKWFDSKPSEIFPAQMSVAVQAHAAYDLTALGMVGRATSRYERWRALVKEQTQEIADYCRAQGHSAPDARASASIVSIESAYL